MDSLRSIDILKEPRRFIAQTAVTKERKNIQSQLNLAKRTPFIKELVDFSPQRFALKPDDKALFETQMGDYRYIPVKVLKDKPRNNQIVYNREKRKESYLDEAAKQSEKHCK